MIMDELKRPLSWYWEMIALLEDPSIFLRYSITPLEFVEADLSSVDPKINSVDTYVEFFGNLLNGKKFCVFFHC